MDVIQVSGHQRKLTSKRLNDLTIHKKRHLERGSGSLAGVALEHLDKLLETCSTNIKCLKVILEHEVKGHEDQSEVVCTSVSLCQK
jgi:hypothetical protein